MSTPPTCTKPAALAAFFSTKEGHRGLGLSAALYVVKKHGGRVPDTFEELEALRAALGIDIRVSDFKRVVRDPRGPLIGLGAQFLLLPVLCLLLACPALSRGAAPCPLLLGHRFFV